MKAESAGLPRCANCGVEIPWRPAVHRGKAYCCGGCVQGGPCYCSYDLATLDTRPSRTHGAVPRRHAVPPAASKEPRTGGTSPAARLGAAGERR